MAEVLTTELLESKVVYNTQLFCNAVSVACSHQPCIAQKHLHPVPVVQNMLLCSNEQTVAIVQWSFAEKLVEIEDIRGRVLP